METNTASISGTCLHMCPREELLMREREGLLHPLEMSVNEIGRKPGPCPKADPGKTVKQFSRPAAGRADTDPSNLRPAPVLQQSVTYLYESVICRDHPAWYSIYEFIFDRLRAVRQDMIIQGIMGSGAIRILEQIVRFHLYSSYRLRDCTVDQFDPVINKQHLLECLKRLLYLYQVTPGLHENRIEFESAYLLDNLGDNHALSHFLELDSNLRKSPLLHLCFEISTANALKNYKRALSLIWKLHTPMCLCAVNPQLRTLRINFLQILSAGYSVKNCKFPISKLTSILHLNSDSETVDLCLECGLIDRFDNTSWDYVCFNRTAFSSPKEAKASSLLILDEMLAQTSLSSLLLGQQAKQTLRNTQEVSQDSSFLQLEQEQQTLLAMRGQEKSGKTDYVQAKSPEVCRAMMSLGVAGSGDRQHIKLIGGGENNQIIEIREIKLARCENHYHIPVKDVLAENGCIEAQGVNINNQQIVGRGRGRGRGKREIANS